MTLEEKFSKILDNLLQKTESGDIHWEPSTGESFATSRPDSSIVIEKEVARERDWTDYTLSLYDGIGRRVESLSARSLPDGYVRAEMLFDLARRTALKVEALADSWLA